HFDQLRMAGLIHLTDWVRGLGQGYALTEEGSYVLQNPRELAKLRAGKLNDSPRVAREPAYQSEGRLTPFERGEQIRAAFVYRTSPVISYALILINVAWFLWGLTIALQHGENLNKFLYASTEEVLRQ